MIHQGPASRSPDPLRVIVTGGAKGIGAAIVRSFADLGAEVVIATRDKVAAAHFAAALNACIGRCAVTAAQLDLSSLQSIQAFAVQQSNVPIDILVNNAGVMELTFVRTDDGFEWNFGVNFLGHFVLSNLLVPSLRLGRSKRIIQLTSGAHRVAPIDLDDLNFEARPFNGEAAYRESKTACALLAVALSDQFRSTGIEAYSVAPGIVPTDLLRSMGDLQSDLMMERFPSAVRNPREAARSVMYAATDRELTGRGGLYIEDCRPAAPSDGQTPSGFAPHGVDPQLARALWQKTEAMLKARTPNWTDAAHV